MNRVLAFITSAAFLILVIISSSSCAAKTNTTEPTTTVVTTSPTMERTTATPQKTTTTTPTTTTKPVVTTPPIKVIFEDNFDSETSGAIPSKWNVNTPAGTAISIDDKIHFGTTGKSAKLEDNSPTETWTMNKIIGTQTSSFWYEFVIRLAQTNQITGGAYIGNSTVTGGRYGIENLGVSIAFWNDGFIKYNDNDNDLLSWKNVQTYEVDKWYKVKIFVDISNQKFNLYIDDVLIFTDIKFRYPMTSLDQIMIVSRTDLPAQTVWIDNVLVTEAK